MGSSSTRINCKFGVLHCLSGETVITDHVRSIVRECLQEADVEWISSQKSYINGNYYEKGCKEDEQALDDRDDQVCEEMVTQEVGIIVSLLKIVLRSHRLLWKTGDSRIVDTESHCTQINECITARSESMIFQEGEGLIP